jgi:hypothetical protein
VARAKSQRRYSDIEDLAKVIYLGSYSIENLMGMVYAGYFDASGKKEGFPILTVAGAIAPVKKWIRFERDWKAALSDEGVSEFHFTDFATSKGEYRDWKGDKERRSSFFDRLLKIIRENTNKLFCSSVDLEGWAEVNAEYYLEEFFHSPYAIAGCAMVSEGIKWARRKKTKKVPEFIFEEGDEGWEGLVELCSRIDIIPIRLPKQKAIPCQVGDMLAWKSRITATNSFRIISKMNQVSIPEIDTLEASLNEGLDSMNKIMVRPVNNGIFGPESLRQTCRNSNVPKRRTVTLQGT